MESMQTLASEKGRALVMAMMIKPDAMAGMVVTRNSHSILYH